MHHKGIKVIRREFLPNTTSDQYDPTTGISTIEYHTSSKDPWRIAAGNEIPIPWPYDRQHSPSLTETHEHLLREKFMPLIKAQNIRLEAISMSKRCVKGTNNLRDTLAIYVREGTRDRSGWKELVTKIKRVVDEEMKTSGLELDIAVEIQGHPSYRDLSSIIEPGSKAHKACLEIEEVVYEQVKKSCPMWTSISYHLRGPSSTWPHGERRPTLMIAVPPGTRNNWCKVEEEIKKAIDGCTTTRDIELGIEIVPGSPELLDQAQTEKTFVWKDRPLNNRHLVGPRWQGDFDGEPKNSSSIGARGSKMGIGTLGVWVYFQAAGSTEKQLCFITTYDVVADGDVENKGSNNEFGIGLDGLPILRDIIIDFPAPLDLSNTKKEYPEDVEVGIEVAEVSEKASKLMEEIAASGGIGQVIHASGVRKNAQGYRGGINAEHPYVYYDPKPDDKITKISPLGQGTWVIKDPAGFIPCGQVNAMYSRAKWADGSETREWEVMCLPGDGSGMYVERGEGGATLVNEKLEWVGMVWGSSGIGGGGLVMDAGAILEDVEARTGGKVSLV